MILRRHLVYALAISSVLCFVSGADAQVADWRQIHIPPLPAFHPQEPRRVELANGMVIFLQEDHELPLIRGTARIRGGAPGTRSKRWLPLGENRKMQ